MSSKCNKPKKEKKQGTEYKDTKRSGHSRARIFQRFNDVALD